MRGERSIEKIEKSVLVLDYVKEVDNIKIYEVISNLVKMELSTKYENEILSLKE